MKKIFVMLLLVLLVAPAAAFAVDTFTAEAIDDSGQLISTLSNKVSLTVSAGGDAYAAVSGHQSGNKIYASSSGDTKLYQKTSDPVALPTLTDSDTAQFQSGGWIAM